MCDNIKKFTKEKQRKNSINCVRECDAVDGDPEEVEMDDNIYMHTCTYMVLRSVIRNPPTLTNYKSTGRLLYRKYWHTMSRGGS